MAQEKKIDLYKKVAITSAGKLPSIVLLVDRAVILLKEAREDDEKRQANIIKTQNILAQLERALDFDAGDVAGSLFFIYDYLFAELNNRDDQALDTATKMLGELQETFKKIGKKEK
ncbi:MAG: hypothetical protein A2350_13085 [Candidatus Raymondbacteria bacterium RifOxyB12_full_50_8]|uniref:Flagellar export chaperone FliS n=1 Tax=Candidatus Raymondbacteria bacterium RIFOXYD12_FULL_49_13 TaxID=1817890 RepID=A0A1F7F0E8_UNCRA|nr:MAG: hypothetical protein A2248_21850 [Candidatus Raymondbacteria bacterium RIFOXYA2_FULL_49_16]OGK00082.1 MAG: hypothetical protein A2519_22405 [Candidatus Raymondbacteria bacterium RIFOXYD12_FULL_49_13]OGK03698.1 MAG: hypothetical protein A2350_13085 [Candidatus Raymondbacteria bacterium RifOxyB12_full_50_8]OGP45071.1 MAG: hypothetical protein A2324_13730 [Candidatus Raymondbacteria bacterium RIFOXYB2_FULL_49_35]